MRLQDHWFLKVGAMCLIFQELLRGLACYGSCRGLFMVASWIKSTQLLFLHNRFHKLVGSWCGCYSGKAARVKGILLDEAVTAI